MGVRPTSVGAQVCRGADALPSGGARVEVAASRFVFGHGVEGSLTVRPPLPGTYAGLSIGRTVDPELDGRTVDAGVWVGGDVQGPTGSRFRICPTAGARGQFGPNRYLRSSKNFRRQDGHAGIGIATVVGKEHGVRFIPSLSAQHFWLAWNVGEAFSDDAPGSRWVTYRRLEAGLGVILDETFSIQGRISRISGISMYEWTGPFARANDDLAATLAISYAFSFRRAAR